MVVSSKLPWRSIVMLHAPVLAVIGAIAVGVIALERLLGVRIPSSPIPFQIAGGARGAEERRLGPAPDERRGHRGGGEPRHARRDAARVDRPHARRARGPVDAAALHAEMESIAAAQLGSTLGALAKGLPIFEVTFMGNGRATVEAKGHVAGA